MLVLYLNLHYGSARALGLTRGTESNPGPFSIRKSPGLGSSQIRRCSSDAVYKQCLYFYCPFSHTDLVRDALRKYYIENSKAIRDNQNSYKVNNSQLLQNIQSNCYFEEVDTRKKGSIFAKIMSRLVNKANVT